MARSVKQTAKAPLSAHQGVPGARGIRGATAPTRSDGRSGAATGANGAAAGSPDPQSDWPIFAELVAELGDPTG